MTVAAGAVYTCLAMRRVWVAIIGVGLVGCFPDYELEADAQPYMARMRSNGRTVEFDLATDVGNRRSAVSFSYDFDIDQNEVTVQRFNTWWNGDRALPSDLASLDDGGVYEDPMRWRANWNTAAVTEAFVWANPDVDTELTCTGPSNTPFGQAPWTTWMMDKNGVADAGDFPMTCVTWMQAAAFCASEGKRLPTAAEWTFARTQGGDAPAFPWGNQLPTQCVDAIVNADGNACDFPTAVSTTARDRTKAGVDDLVGSVFEWLWEASWPDAVDETDWVGAKDNLDSPDREHLRAGGAFISEPTEPRVSGLVEKFGANQQYYDAGFRCARSVK